MVEPIFPTIGASVAIVETARKRSKAIASIYLKSLKIVFPNSIIV